MERLVILILLFVSGFSFSFATEENEAGNYLIDMLNCIRCKRGFLKERKKILTKDNRG